MLQATLFLNSDFTTGSCVHNVRYMGQTSTKKQYMDNLLLAPLGNDILYIRGKTGINTSLRPNNNYITKTDH